MNLPVLLLLLTANIIQSQFFNFNFTPFEPKPGQRCAGRNYSGGKRCCTPKEPCGLGEGDCDGPGDGGQHDGHAGCKGDLVCGSNNCKQFGSYYHEKDDCCEKPSRNSAVPTDTYYPNTPLVPPEGQRCKGRNYEGGRRCCTPKDPCDLGEGDCDGPGDGGQHDGHAGCKGDLVCGTNNCKKFGAYYHAKDDCCEKPSSPLISSSPSPVRIDNVTTIESFQRCKGRNFIPRPCCTPENPCPEGQGDCEIDNDCAGNLVCGNNNCKQFGSFFHEKDDCCVQPEPPSLPKTTKKCRGRNFFPRPCCTPGNPCPEGEGDCEIDNDCAGNLVCGNNNCKQFGSFFHEKDDCCIKPLPKSPQQTRSKCKGRNFAPRPCCTPENPCPEGEGDCEIDNDCAGNLVCGNNNCKQFGSFFHEKDDCCVKPKPPSLPKTTKRCRGRNFFPRPCCTPGTPCPEGEGDCEIDNDCAGNLVCGNNNCKQFGSFFHEKDDCCIKPSPSIKIQNTKPISSVSVPLEPKPGQRCAGRNYQGRRCCTPQQPCDEGEGDCDGPGDGGQHDGHAGCKGDLVCGTNNCLKFGLYFHPKDDCCERAQEVTTAAPAPPPGVWIEPPSGEKCSGRNYQGRRCCTPESPCDVGQGDCDGPGDGGQHDGNRGCRDGLVCGSNNCLKFGAYFHPKDDCCEFPDGTGGWGQWGEFGPCSKSCGVGSWSRHRYCKGPGCPHTTQSQQRLCNFQPC